MPPGRGRGSKRQGEVKSRFLFSTAGESPCCICHLPRCPYATVMRLWNWELDGQASDVDKGPSTLGKLPRASQHMPYTTTTPTKKRKKKKRRVIVIGDSLLKVTEGPICCPDPNP